MPNKIEASKEAVNKMLFYYNQALLESGCPDVKREMATQIPKMINLSSEQALYVMEEVEVLTIMEMLENANVLLKALDNQAYVYDRENKSLEIISSTIEMVISMLDNGKTK